jgi:large repetitive protein
MAQWLNWGDGSDGSPNAISGIINTYAACTGTAGQSVLTTALAASAGDQILVHQSQHATAAGTWEIVKVVSDAGATLNLYAPLVNSYSTGAQAVLIPQYTGGDISGAVTGSAWNGTVGGIIALISNGSLTISGSLSIAGSNTTSGIISVAGATGGGFRGGTGIGGSSNTTAYQGEGTTGVGGQSTSANGNAGGGAYVKTSASDPGGGNGGNGTAGSDGNSSINEGVGGTGGAAAGVAALTTMVFGGAGGGKNHQDNNTTEGGASSGGIVFIIAKSITITGSITANGGTHTNVNSGGAAAGGSVLIKTQVAVLGTGKITASGGSNAGDGRIHIDYYTSVTGTTTPTLSSTQDLTLNVSSFFQFF